MPILELSKPEGKYTYDMSGSGHFSIDCICGGKDGKYSGSHYKKASDDLRKVTDKYSTPFPSKYPHTFYMSYTLFNQGLRHDHREENTEEPAILVCNDCAREFTFSFESYHKLIQEMQIEYNRRITMQNTQTDN